jgi:hypothetical protein
MPIHPLQYKQPQNTQGHIPEHEDKCLQLMFVCNQTITMTANILYYASYIF